MSNPEPDGTKPSLFRRVAGGSPSRAELYGIVGAIFLLIVGGVSSAAVLVSHKGSTPAATTATSPPTLLSASWEVSTCTWPAWSDSPHPGGIIDFHYSNGTTRNVYVDARQYQAQVATYSGGTWWASYITVTHDDLGNVIPGNGLQIWYTQAHITSGQCGPAVFGKEQSGHRLRAF